MSATYGARGRVVVVGSLNADYLMTTERRPDPGETVGGAELQVLIGGKGTNQAVAASRCGAAVAIVGRVGRDAIGSSVVEALESEGVDTDSLLATGARTGVAFIVLTPDGQNSILVAPGANAALGPSEILAAEAAIAAADALVAQFEVPVEAVEKALDLAPTGCRTILNLSPWVEEARSLVSRASVVVVNEHEAEALTEAQVSSSPDAAVAAQRILALGAAAAVVTLGSQGAVFSDDGGTFHVPAPDVAVLDTTGAGDAFVGALASSLATGGDFAAAVTKAVEVGAATTTIRGAFAQTLSGDEGPGLARSFRGVD